MYNYWFHVYKVGKSYEYKVLKMVNHFCYIINTHAYLRVYARACMFVHPSLVK